MIKLVEFHNFKSLRNARLPLEPFTLLVGPNGSGKSTVLQALRLMDGSKAISWQQIVTASQRQHEDEVVEVTLHWDEPYQDIISRARWSAKTAWPTEHRQTLGGAHTPAPPFDVRLYAFHAEAIQQPTRLEPWMILHEDGSGLAGVLDQLRDSHPERFHSFNETLCAWLPEFDQLLFETPETGHRAFWLRTKRGGYKIPARDLSQGTLLALALLTLAYLPEPPSLVCLEEPDRGMHPWLLRRVQDALYRLSHPESGGETRPPVQVIATTHSPYFLDLFREHPEEIVLTHKVEEETHFKRLSDHPDLDEMLEDAFLSEIWYTGILDGVPAR